MQAVVGALGSEASEAQAVVESQAAAWRDLDVQLDEERAALEARREAAKGAAAEAAPAYPNPNPNPNPDPNPNPNPNPTFVFDLYRIGCGRHNQKAKCSEMNRDYKP